MILSKGWKYLSFCVLIGATSCKIQKHNDPFEHPIVSDDTKLKELLIKATTEKVLENYSEAISQFEGILQVYPNTGVAHFELSEIYEKKRNAEKSIFHAEKAAEISPENIWYKSHLADIYNKTGQFLKAEKSYIELLEGNEKDLSLLYNLAEVYLNQGKVSSAITTYNKVENVVGMSPELSIYKKDLHLRNNNYQGAIDEIEALSNEFPSQSKYLVMLAELHDDNDNLEAADKIYQRLINSSNIDGDAYIALGNYYASQDSIDIAFFNYEKGLSDPDAEVERKSETCAKLLLYAKQAPEKKDEIKRLFDLTIEANPEAVVFYRYGADLAVLMEDDEYLEMMMNGVLNLAPDNLESWYEYAMVLLVNEKYEKLDSISNIGRETFPNQPTFYYFGGIASNSLKNFEIAIEHLEYGKDLAFNQPSILLEFYRGLGDAYNGVKNYEQSDLYFEKVLEKEPKNLYVLNNYSYYLAVRKQNLDKAKQMIETALMEDPMDPTFLDTYGWVLFQSKKYPQAVETLEKAVKQNQEKSGLILEHLGDAYFMNNQKAKAINYWKKAQSKSDHSELLSEKLLNEKYIDQ